MKCFSSGSDDKQSAYSVGDLGSIPGLGRSLEEGMATHCSIHAWRIPMDRGPWWTTVHGVTKSRTQLSDKAQHMSEMLGTEIGTCEMQMKCYANISCYFYW